MQENYERDKVLERITNIGSEKREEKLSFLSHILNITSRQKWNGDGLKPELLGCSHYGVQSDLITLLPLNGNYKKCLSENIANKICPFYDSKKEDKCFYSGNNPYRT